MRREAGLRHVDVETGHVGAFAPDRFAIAWDPQRYRK